MNIIEKIEEIKQQPESVRMRWVWGCVIVSMFLIITIWVFSISSIIKGNNSSNSDNIDNIGSLKTQLQGINKQAPSINNYTESKEIEEESIKNENNSDFEYPKTDKSTTEIPQSPAYSNKQ